MFYLTFNEHMVFAFIRLADRLRVLLGLLGTAVRDGQKASLIIRVDTPEENLWVDVRGRRRRGGCRWGIYAGAINGQRSTAVNAEQNTSYSHLSLLYGFVYMALQAFLLRLRIAGSPLDSSWLNLRAASDRSKWVSIFISFPNVHS